MPLVLVAGATGHLGSKIVAALLNNGAAVRILLRPETPPGTIENFRLQGVQVAVASYTDAPALERACAGAGCVVSALAGLDDVIITAQQALLQAAVAAGVPRFIPSDYSLDFTPLPAGRNRNLDFRKTFQTLLDDAPIQATSVFNGAFMELLTGEMPLILPRLRRILAWGPADTVMDFTLTDDVAAFTARAALDGATPRLLHIAGDRLSARQFVALLTDLTGRPYGLLRPGGIGLLNTLIGVTRTLSPGKGELYPPWQGMQYMRDMMEGRVQPAAYDNDRYPGLSFTSVRAYLLSRGMAQLSKSP